MTISFWADFKHKELLPIKLLLFLQASGDTALYPFLTLHMKYLGISVSDIGLQFALSPVATLIATPLVGLLADKVGNFKLMLSVSLIICAALSQLFLLVPAVIKIRIDDLNWDNNTVFTCQPELGLVHFNAQVNESVLLKGCKAYCPPDTTLRPNLCFIKGSEERCNLSDVPFDVAFSNQSDISNSTHVIYYNATYDSVLCKVPLPDRSCGIRCESGETKNARFKTDPTSKAITFWAYLAIRIALFVAISIEMSLLKAAILTMLDKHDSDYGFQRLWASLAVCVVPPVTGIIMDKLKKGDIEDYRPSFYIYGGMKVVMAIVTLILDLSVKTPSLHVLKNLGKLLKNVEADILLIYCIFIGSCWGFLETFFLLYMEGLGASKSIMGLTFTVGAGFGIPVTLVAGFLARKFGHVPLISFGLLVYCGRFIGYSYIVSPYEALGLEALESITMGLMIITITTYSNILAGKELVATMQATWASLHFAVGKAVGSMAGGYMIEEMGTRTTYRTFAGMSAFMGLLYMFVHFVYFKKADGVPEVSSQSALHSEKEKPSYVDDAIVKKVSLDMLNAASEKAKIEGLQADTVLSVNQNSEQGSSDFRLRLQKEFPEGGKEQKKSTEAARSLGEFNLGCEVTHL